MKIHYIIYTIIISFFLCNVQYVKAGTTPFITTWQTTTANESIIIPTIGAGYNYTVDWGDGDITNEVGDATHVYATPNIYTVSITGDFPRIYFNADSSFVATTAAQIANAGKIQTVEQWGNNTWVSMEKAFAGCANLNISNPTIDIPDLSNLTNTSEMFVEAAAFDGEIGNWDVSSVTDMSEMFKLATSFNQDIGNWNVSNVTAMNSMFDYATSFNKDISFKAGQGIPFGDAWNVSSVTDMSFMFRRASAFDIDIGNWNVSNVTFMNSMFVGTSFNQDIGNWNVSSVTSMTLMFADNPVFNQNISFKAGQGVPFGDAWNVSSVTQMNSMFQDTGSFNGDISNWQVNSVTSMFSMFNRSSVFNIDISTWNVSAVMNMGLMFSESVFDQDIGGWDVSSVTDMRAMFREASSFNQDIGTWDVSSVTDMTSMFRSATSFDQDLGSWEVTALLEAISMFTNVTLSTENYDSLLIGWNTRILNSNVIFSGGNSMYCAGEMARENMIDNDLWTITDGGLTGLEVNDLTDQNAEGSFTLPVIQGTDLTGDQAYYTESNGMGTSFESGDIITFDSSVTYPISLYIFDGSGGCTSEESFELTLTELCTQPTADILPDISECSSYILPVLSADNLYYTATNADGLQLSAGNEITSSQTIYIFNGTATCFDESSFEVTILDNQNFTLDDSNIDISFFNDLTVNIDDSGLNYEYAVDNQQYQSVNVFPNLSIGSHTLYVRSPNGCIEQSLSFETTNNPGIVIPNFFTPNEDARNDLWEITDTNNNIQSVAIFDRYGKLVSTLNPQNLSWNGTFNGKLLPSSDYWYFIKGSDNNIPFEIKGHFALKR